MSHSDLGGSEAVIGSGFCPAFNSNISEPDGTAEAGCGKHMHAGTTVKYCAVWLLYSDYTIAHAHT